MDKKTKNENIRIRLTSAEKVTIEKAAAKVGLPTTTWVRQLLLRHIKNGLLVLAALLVAGCQPATFDPAQPIAVEFSPEWSPEQIAVFRGGVSYWDGLAAFCMADECAGAAQHLVVVKDDAHGDAFAGEWDPTTDHARMRSLEVDLAIGDARWSPLVRAALAHELGHSIGLQHVVVDDAVMFRAESMLDGITSYDVDEFFRVWPSQ